MTRAISPTNRVYASSTAIQRILSIPPDAEGRFWIGEHTYLTRATIMKLPGQTEEGGQTLGELLDSLPSSNEGQKDATTE